MKKELDADKVKIGVVGAGTWGTVLADLLGRKGYKVDLWAYETEVIDQILAHKENRIFLPGYSLSENIFPSDEFHQVVSDKDLILIVVPSHVIRKTAIKFADYVSKKTVIISASKGIENKTHMTMTNVLKDVFPEIPEDCFAVLSGPSFAQEVIRQVPTVVTVASKKQDIAEWIQQIFATPVFRVYTSDDIIGVELGGAVKNVIAIAAGIIDGLGLGLNTRAALITRGLTEIRRLGLKLGANPRTFTGLTGFGDLVLTCTGDLSRNHMVGKKIGEGMTLKKVLSDMRMVAEGIRTAKSVNNLSCKLGVNMPICHMIYLVLYDGLSPEKAVHMLMTRDLKQELDEL
jgi:glycerol-3-phosphate dehydrogenase (NAD(P)+)